MERETRAQVQYLSAITVVLPTSALKQHHWVIQRIKSGITVLYTVSIMAFLDTHLPQQLPCCEILNHASCYSVAVSVELNVL